MASSLNRKNLYKPHQVIALLVQVKLAVFFKELRFHIDDLSATVLTLAEYLNTKQKQNIYINLLELIREYCKQGIGKECRLNRIGYVR